MGVASLQNQNVCTAVCFMVLTWYKSMQIEGVLSVFHISLLKTPAVAKVWLMLGASANLLSQLHHHQF